MTEYGHGNSGMSPYQGYPAVNDYQSGAPYGGSAGNYPQVPNYPQAPSFHTPQPGYPGMAQPGYAAPPIPAYPVAQPVAAYGYPQGGYNAAAPYGVDPATGIPFSDRSKVTAGFLQLFLGGLGAGRWYIGTTGIAATQLILWFVAFVTSFIFFGFLIFVGLGIWILIDAIMIFTGSVRDGQGRILR